MSLFDFHLIFQRRGVTCLKIAFRRNETLENLLPYQSDTKASTRYLYASIIFSEYQYNIKNSLKCIVLLNDSYCSTEAWQFILRIDSADVPSEKPRDRVKGGPTLCRSHCHVQHRFGHRNFNHHVLDLKIYIKLIYIYI